MQSAQTECIWGSDGLRRLGGWLRTTCTHIGLRWMECAGWDGLEETAAATHFLAAHKSLPCLRFCWHLLKALTAVVAHWSWNALFIAFISLSELL